MMTQTHTAPRKVNPSAALASAEDEFREEVYAMYEGVTEASVGRDLTDLETLAELTLRYAAGVSELLKRMEYAPSMTYKYAFMDLLLDTLSDELDHGAGLVVKANVARIQAREAGQ